MALISKHEITLDWVKETKNTHVYGTDEHSAAVNQLYIRKSAFSGEAPEQIVIKISEPDV